MPELGALRRNLGIVGVLMVHMALLVCYFLLAAAVMQVGRYAYDGILSTLGLGRQVFALNRLPVQSLLPVCGVLP